MSRILRLALAVAVLVVVVGVLPAVVWELGGGLHARRIDPGVGYFEGVEKQMAEAALTLIYFHYDDRWTLMVDERAERVWWCPGVDSEKERRRALWALGGFGAAVRPYTLFGIPEGRITITCEGDRFRWELF